MGGLYILIQLFIQFLNKTLEARVKHLNGERA